MADEPSSDGPVPPHQAPTQHLPQVEPQNAPPLPTKSEIDMENQRGAESGAEVPASAAEYHSAEETQNGGRAAEMISPKSQASPLPTPAPETHQREEGDGYEFPPSLPSKNGVAQEAAPATVEKDAEGKKAEPAPVTRVEQQAPAIEVQPAAEDPTQKRSQRTDSTASQPRTATSTMTSSGAAAPSQSRHSSSNRSSTSTAATFVHSRSSLSSLNKGSAVFVLTALETIAASKEARKGKELKEAATRALEMVKAASASSAAASSAGRAAVGGGSAEAVLDPRTVFEPLRLACATGSTPLIITAVDCIGKLVSYSFFAEDAPINPSSASAATSQSTALADNVTDTVCNSFVEGSDEKAQLQIIKALLAIVLSNSVHVHQGSLLKAVRTVYNIFLLSKSPANQAVAQGSLTQMVHHVFGRVPRPSSQGSAAQVRKEERSGSLKSSESMGSVREEQAQAEHAAAASSGQKAESVSEGVHRRESSMGESEIPLDDEKADESMPVGVVAQGGTESGRNPDASIATAADAASPLRPQVQEEKVTLRSLETRKSFEGANEKDTVASLGPITAQELFVKDAFLVLRALCKLSMKPLGAESERDLRSHGMRSKLLSLHLILTILKSHMSVFQDDRVVIHSSSTGEQTAFVQATKQYICLSLSRNAVSSVNQIFELACEIFWLVMSGMRTKMKKEIEVLLNEIFLPILEMRNSTPKQKSILLNVLIRLCRDPQALVEVYINYDCDRTALDNIYERLMNIVSRISQTHVGPGSNLSAAEPPSPAAQRQETGGPTIPPTLNSTTGGAAGGLGEDLNTQPIEVRLKRLSLECLCSVLRSLVQWSNRNALHSDSASLGGSTLAAPDAGSPRTSEDVRPSEGPEARIGDVSPSGANTPLIPSTPDPSRLSMSGEIPQDDPSRFESAKQRKNTLVEGIRKFNEKPKRGIEFLVQNGFIRSKEPKDVARFLLYADGLNKSQIGEYLGEGEPHNIATMHAFVDLINFDNTHFLAALRKFLQAFRLPGEAQKIDRYMLKFAERYLAGNPEVFRDADTAYILAFSIIMLNTDAHSPQVKHRMTLQDFIKNNSGLPEPLSDDFLKDIYDDIQTNEIKMKDEELASSTQVGGAGGLAGAIATVGRDLQREAYELQSEGMANKTEALFRTMVRAQRRIAPQQRAAAEHFFSASHLDHVKPMFEVAWMPFLAGVSGPLQDSDDMEIVELCLQGFRDAIHIVCLFGLELERNAFVTTLAKFTFLNNLGEMKAKNIEAIKTLLGIAQTEGNYLKGSWRELLTCVSQLERFQLISGGVDENSLPDLGRRRSTAPPTRVVSGPAATKSRQALPTEDVVQAGASTEVTVAADMVFSSTPHLSGTAIVDFVQALSEVSWEEIQSSGMTDNPRLFSLQKLVEISYYNMERIRMEWSQIWAILGEHFNQVLITSSPAVSAFSVDALRQLSMRFLEKEELPRFAFQKDFLRPFAYAAAHSPEIETREMIIDCLWQMVQARSANLRSGWTSLFVILTAASKDSSERVCSQAFELTQSLFESHFKEIVQYSFADFTVCLTSFSKSKAQRISLQAIAVLRGVVPAMLRLSNSPGKLPTTHAAQQGEVGDKPQSDPLVSFWFPCLFAFHDIVMNGEDLEVRRVALDSLFDILKKHGHTFRPDFWDTICQEVLFPIFSVLRSRNDVTRFSTHEDMSVWLSTTMIHALRNLVDLWTFYFDTLERLLPGLLDLLCACICQENDTLARIGTSCLQQLLEKNVTRFNALRWSQVADTFVQLFRTTTAHQLFDSSLRAGGATAPSRPDTPDAEGREGFNTPRPLSPGVTQKAPGASLSPPIAMSASERRRAFKQIIVKCVLQLLLIDTTHELLLNGTVYERIPADQLLRLLNALQDSYEFAKRFNADKDLRMALWKVGFMKQLPNLLKQESSSASTLVSVLVKMHEDERQTHRAARAAIRRRLVPLGEDILASYIPLDPDTQARNITAWTPVVCEILRGVCTFEDESSHKEEDERSEEERQTFTFYASTFYPLAVDLVAKEPLAHEITTALRAFFHRVGIIKGLYDLEREERRRKERAAPPTVTLPPQLTRADSIGGELVATTTENGQPDSSAAAATINGHGQLPNGHQVLLHRPQPLSLVPRVVVDGPELETVTPSTAQTALEQTPEQEAGLGLEATPFVEISHAPTPPIVSAKDEAAKETQKAEGLTHRPDDSLVDIMTTANGQLESQP